MAGVKGPVGKGLRVSAWPKAVSENLPVHRLRGSFQTIVSELG